MKKTLSLSVFAALVALMALTVVQPASAHFYVKDADSGVQAIFHVTPNHNPVAGEESVISYDFAKTGFEASDFSYVLTVKSTKAEAVTVPVEVSGNVVLASYIFPSQGFYGITLEVKSSIDNSISTLQYGQRVSRGAAAQESKGFGAFEIITISGVTLIGVGAIIFSLINDRRKRKE